ncbi:MAG: alpha/beta hydrolase-fold protein [Pseudomonadota bacterium]
MRRNMIAVLALIGVMADAAHARLDPPISHPFFHVELAKKVSAQASGGRLLLFAMEAKAAEAMAMEQSKSKSNNVDVVDADPFNAMQTSVAALEVKHWVPGQKIAIDADSLAFPAGYSQLPEGDYFVQAVLDVDHSYNYTGRHTGDVVSEVIKVHFPLATAPELTLVNTLPPHDPWQLSVSAPKASQEISAATRQHAQAIDFISPSLSSFWGHPIHMRGWVLTPPAYDPKTAMTYPAVYFTHGFGGSADGLVRNMIETYSAMSKGEISPMVWIFLDESSATGTHEFADSVNNGPWGHALTGELIPQLESKYRLEARANGRFLLGHSSGGWATLWLQTRYPKIFGGTWSTSPDPSDFHDFSGIDLYAKDANVYIKPDSSAYPLVRDHGKVLGTFQQFAQLERVLGAYGGQLASFDWVFSPRGKDGSPQAMFNRDTGEVDATVATYWREHYDIAYRLQKEWPKLRADLDGKIHLIVGTADTFYLDGAAYKLKAVLDGLKAKTDFRFLPDRTHFDLYKIGEDRGGLLKQISWEMYAQARPKSSLHAPDKAP